MPRWRGACCCTRRLDRGVSNSAHGDGVKKIDVSDWPFGKLVGLSLGLTAVHGLLQINWFALRYKSLGPRPVAAQVFIACEFLLMMTLLTAGLSHICNEKSTKPKGRYYLGIVAVAGAWILVSFVI